MTGTKWLPDLSKTTESKYIVLIQSLRGAIRSGDLAKGTKMPPVRELAYQLGITPGTVARVYKMGTEEGLLEATVGRGTFVADSVAPDSTPAQHLLSQPVAPHVTDLRSSCPPDVGQGDMIRSAMATLAQQPGPKYINYPNPDMDRPLRNEIVDWIGPNAVGHITADDVLLGAGAQNMLVTLLQTTLRGQSPVALTEETCYPGTRYALQLQRAEAIGVECDNEGIRPDRLESILREKGGQVLMTTSNMHNPTNVHTPLHRRQEIADLARRYQLQIIEDESFSYSPTDDIPGYRALCPERAWYVGSLSKCFSPSVRLGYAVCAQGQADAARRVSESAYFGLPTPLVDLCTLLFQRRNIHQARDAILAEIRVRAQIAVNILGRWDISWTPETMFIWLRLPQGWRTSRFTLACEAAGVKVKPGDDFALHGGNAEQAVRIGINCQLPRQQIEDAFYRIAKVLSEPPSRIEV